MLTDRASASDISFESYYIRDCFLPYDRSNITNARALRKNMTPAENRIWYKILRNKTFHGLRFERQKQIGCYIVDFYCAKQKLAIEIDGDSHYSETASEYDKKRTERLKSLGVTIVRYTNKEIMENLDGVFIDLETTLGLKE